MLFLNPLSKILYLAVFAKLSNALIIRLYVKMPQIVYLLVQVLLLLMSPSLLLELILRTSVYFLLNHLNSMFSLEFHFILALSVYVQ